MTTPTLIERPSRDARNAWLCATAVAIVFMAPNPFVEMSFNDDWSYAFTVKRFLATGHISYHGWSTAAIITQTLWGALFSELFGFSHTTLRFSILPFAMGTAAICYLLGRKSGLSAKSAIFVAMTLCFSPLFLPVATSFMTDVPGLFFILLSLYALAITVTGKRKILWLFVAVASGILGGMSRQVVWIAPLALIPYVAFLRRRDRTFVFICVIGWLMVAADASVTMMWFDRQRDVMLDPSIRGLIANVASNPGTVLLMFTKTCLTTVLMVLPAALPFCVMAGRRIWRERNGRMGVAAILVCIAAAIALRVWPTLGFEPWLENSLTPTGILGDLELFGNRPVAQPDFLRSILSGVTIIALGLILIIALDWLLHPAKAFSQCRNFFAASDGQVAMPIISIFVLAYFAALGPRAAQMFIFDRYALELIPLLAIALLLRIPRPGSASIAMLGIFGLFALVFTQDVLALGRARYAAARRLEAAGIPRTAFADGFEFNFWTQLDAQGYINRAGIANPTHAFNPLTDATPALCCKYRIEFNPRSGETEPSGFGSIDYISWLPPFHRRIYIDQYRNPWWLSPHQPQSPPMPGYWEGYHVY